MPARNVFLRIMLWSLAIAGAGGVLAVLTQGRSIAWRIVGTGLTTALACGIMIPVSNLVDRKETRAAGLFGMGAVFVEFVLALLLIWEIPRRLLSWSIEGQIGGTMALGALASVFILGFLQEWRRPNALRAVRAGILLTSAAVTAFLLAIWLPNNWTNRNIQEDWAQTGFALVVLGGLAVVCLFGGRAEPPRRWRFIGLTAGVIASLMWLTEIWIGKGSDLGFAVFCGLLCIATVAAHANLCVRAPLAPNHNWVMIATIVFAALTAALIELLVVEWKLYSMPQFRGLIERLTAAGGIVTGCGSLALAVLARLNRKVDLDVQTADLSRISVVCPRCRKKQMIGVGDSVCSGCKLRISIRVEEPRCPNCDYLLFRLTSDRCPECGMAIGETAALGAAP